MSNVPAVCILDPKDSAPPDPLRIRLPTALLPRIAQGTFELGDADEPTNSYSFGERAELFQLKFVGKCRCQSGYVGLIAAESLKGRRKAPWDWEGFRAGVDRETISFPHEASGFLFAGPIVHSDSVSVFKHEVGGKVAGLVITRNGIDLPYRRERASNFSA